jgi:16S rRNA (guanine1516-N2)-methyltransferase
MNRVKAVISLGKNYYERDLELAQELQLQHLNWSKYATLKPKQLESKLRGEFSVDGEESAYIFIRRDGILSLAQVGLGSFLTISADFCGPTLNYRRTKGGGKSQLLAKAIGLNRKANLRVLDGTAGLGRDAFILASLGCSIQMIERVAEVSLLLSDALKLAREATDKMDSDFAATIDRIELIKGDSHEYISNLAEISMPDVIYLDPMFPERKKSSLVKKEMRVFHDLVGPDGDADQLLLAALECRARRIVVKRPRIAPTLKAATLPSHTLSGKSNRYDVYINP